MAMKKGFLTGAIAGVSVAAVAMAGAGVLSLALSEDHYSEPSQNAARSILKRPFNQYDRPIEGEAFLCYGAFDSGHGMFQMGGEYWSEFFLQLVTTLFKTQRADGSWLMRQGLAAQFSGSYTTALTILALSPPDQMLPIFER